MFTLNFLIAAIILAALVVTLFLPWVTNFASRTYTPEQSFWGLYLWIFLGALMVVFLGKYLFS